MKAVFLFVVLLAAVVNAQVAATRPSIPPKQEGVLRVAFFGDSITGNRPLVPYQKDYLKFADLTGLLLESRLGAGRVEAINLGWAGDKTTPKPNEGWPGGVARAEADLPALRPDIVVVLFGGNNNPRTPEDEARLSDGLTRIVLAGKNAGARVLMLKYPPALPAPENQVGAWNHLATGANPIIEKVAEAQKMPVLDLGPAMLEAARKYPRTELANAKDGVHLAPRGEMVFALAIYSRLVDLGWATAPATAPRTSPQPRN